ncbi:HAD-IB family hydrolase [Clostridium hydrogeniformans]|uniref:HAD-IB family hydrolase n=1 Tax=Clostridium hydrogeniformans TaxID=349933 RepID=UPI000486C21E|nr:HAD-IB family hydrolase [Clostridium hydrogeniformans]
MEKLAIFDVDYTLTKKETLRQLYYFLLSKNMKNIIYIPRAIFSGIMFLLKIYDERKTKECFLKFIDGVKEDDMKKLVKEFYEKRLSRIFYKDALDMIKKLKKEGYKIYLISASPEFYLNELYSIKEVDKVIGTKFTVKEGSHRRLMEGNNCKGEEKVIRLKEELKKDRVEVDFKNSYMFSDSLSDLPLFNLVGRPYLINYRKSHDTIEILKWR